MWKLPSWKAPKSGALSLLAAGLTFSALSLWQARPKTGEIPVMVRFVAAGVKVSAQDVRFEAVNQLTPATVDLGHYAAVPLAPGEVLSPPMLTTIPAQGVTVAIAPTSTADLAVAKTGGWVNVLVIGPHGLLWQSGPVEVVHDAHPGILGTSGGGSVDVRLTMSQALRFDLVKQAGAVALVGESS